MPQLYVQRDGGPHGEALVCLHGLGASAGVWDTVTAALGATWPGPVVSVDLPGHGASEAMTEVSYTAMATAVARAVAPLDSAMVVGHSLGGVVALALTARDIAFPVTQSLAVGVRLRWSPEDLATARRRAMRPARLFATEAEALTYALKVAGLPTDIPRNDPRAARLVRREDNGFRASFEPGASPAGRTRQHPTELVARLVEQSPVPITLARGESDPSVCLSDLRSLDPAAVELPDSRHSPHIDNPRSMADLILQLSEHPSGRIDQRPTRPAGSRAGEQK